MPVAILESFRLQQGWCEAMGSHLYGTVLQACVQDLEQGGPVADVVRDFDLEPVGAALAVRLMGGVHRLVLMGLAPALARHYPSVGGKPDVATLGSDFVATVSEHRGYVREALHVAPQTNDIGRSLALLPGIMSVLGRGGGRVRLLEIGSSGGLNLLPDRYRYETDAWSWGPSTASAVVRGDWRGDPPPLDGRLHIVERRGCDVNPLDLTREDAQLRLLSFIWPDQLERFERTRDALEVADADPPAVDRADAADWLTGQLEHVAGRGTLTVVQHSTMWQYLPPPTQAAVERAIEQAGSAATRSRPVAHIAFEPSGPTSHLEGHVLTVTRWPGGHRRELATAHAHCAWIDWMG